MDFTKNLVLKENYSFLVADAEGQVAGGERGLYNRDTRFLNRYAWTFGEGFQTLLAHSPRPDRFFAHHALIEGPSQLVGITRSLQILPEGLRDRLELENSSVEPQALRLELDLGSDFADIFEARGWQQLDRDGIRTEQGDARFRFCYHAEDGLEFGVTLAFSRPAERVSGEGAAFEFTLAPGEKRVLEVDIELNNPLAAEQGAAATGMTYEAWRAQFDARAGGERHQLVLEQAIDDLRALLLFTGQGPILAAGIPWYVSAFGRDALLSAIMMLPWGRDVAEGTLRYLAAHQGREYDAYRAEAPGKIMHEQRFGERTRLGQTPHSPYYGTIDATALFVMLLHETWRQGGSLDLVRELRPNWEAALGWMQSDADPDGDGFLEFVPPEADKGLVVQSWKDSWDSMSHADGTLAEGALAVSEVQGYAFAAYRAAAEFYDALGEPAKAMHWRETAANLATAFQRAFWLPDMQTYAMALDGRKKPLGVHNSDAGQLLWTGIVPEDTAPALAATLMSNEMWSGWGIRTLGKHERRYNAVSYHNGSVWPHDNALIAAGLARYGMLDEARTIRDALFDLAASQFDCRPPELVAGYDRTDAPPVPYPVACRPQAWDAAALLYLLRL